MSLSRHLTSRALAAGLAMLAASAFAGQITLYEHADFRGRAMIASDALTDVERSGFGDRVVSVFVADGTWEACTQPNFRGQCAELRPGTYRWLGSQMTGPVASVRQIGHGYEARPARIVIAPDPSSVTTATTPVVVTPHPAPIVINPSPVPVVVASEPRSVVIAAPAAHPVTIPAGPRITLYQRMGSDLRAVELTSSVDDLNRRGFDNGADAAFVSGGVWRLCDRDGGRGQCAEFSPGQYGSLGVLDRRVSSAYLISAAPEAVATVTPVPAGRIVLYEFPNFGAPSASVEYGRAPDISWTQFRHPASSLRIESGSWLVCSDMGYQGECRVLEPGDYPMLTGILSQGVASVRQVWRPEYAAVDGGLDLYRRH